MRLRLSVVRCQPSVVILASGADLATDSTGSGAADSGGAMADAASSGVDDEPSPPFGKLTAGRPSPKRGEGEETAVSISPRAARSAGSPLAGPGLGSVLTSSLAASSLTPDPGSTALTAGCPSVS